MKKLTAVLTALVIIFSIAGFTSAVSAADLAKTGTLTITTEFDGVALSDINVEIFMLASAENDNSGKIRYIPAEDFANALENKNYDANQINAGENSALAAFLKSQISANNIKGDLIKTDNNGKAIFKNLKTGLYLIIQNQNGESNNNNANYNMQSFIVPVPYSGTNGADYNYLVKAKPKIERIELGSLSLTKTVTGTNADINKAFTFTVKFEGYNLSRITSDRFITNDGGATWTGTLRHGVTVNFENIPVNTVYEITEDNYSADGYTANVAVGRGAWSGNIKSETPVEIENIYTAPTTDEPEDEDEDEPTTEPTTEKETEKETEKATEKETEKETEKATERETERETGTTPTTTTQPTTQPETQPETVRTTEPAIDEQDSDVYEEAEEEEVSNGRIPLRNGWWAEDLGDGLYEIFDENGVPLGFVQLKDGEKIEDWEDYENLIPLVQMATETEIKIIQMLKNNPITGDKLPIILIALIISAVIIVIVVRNRKNKTNPDNPDNTNNPI